MDDTITLYLDGERELVGATEFLRAARCLLSLLNEIDKALRQEEEPALSWDIWELRSGSAAVSLTPLWREPIPQHRGQAVIRAALKGFTVLRGGADRPPHFSDEALNAAKDLATMVGKEAKRLIIHSEDNREELNPGIAENAEQLLKTNVEELGTIDGTLKVVTLNGPPRFNLYDSVTGKAVTCHFCRDDLPKVAAALGKRVTVTGVLSYSPDGHLRSVKDIVVFDVYPDDSNLPTKDDLLAAGLDLSGGQSLAAFMEKRYEH